MTPKTRIAVAIGGILGVLAILALVALKAVGPFAARRLSSELADRGIVATVEGFSLSADGARVRRLCLEPAEGSGGQMCFDDLEVGLAGLTRLQPEPTSVRFSAGSLDLSAAHGDLNTQIDAWTNTVERLLDSPARPEGSGDAAPRTEPRAAARPIELDARSFVVTLAGQSLPAQTVSIDRVAGSAAGEQLTLSGHISAQTDAALLPSGLTIPPGFEVNAHRDANNPLTVTVRGDDAVRITLPAPLASLTASLSAITFAAPYTFSFEALRLEQAGGAEPVVDIPTAAIALRELTLDPAELYLGALEISSPTFVFEVDESGQPTAFAALRTAAAGVAEGSDEVPADGSGDAAPANDNASGGLWADREWWQKIPQSIEITNATVVAFRSGARDQALELHAETLNYAIRIFNFQLDLTVRGGLKYAGEAAGSVQLDGVWGWQNSNLRLNTHVEDLDLSALTSVLALPIGVAATGELDFDTRFSEAARGPGLQFTGALNLEDFALVREATDAEPARTYDFGRVSYAWEASRTEGDGDPPVFRFTRGDLEINGARASIRPALHRFNYQRTPFAHRIDLPFEVPAQSASVIADAVPAWLLGPLEGMQLSGDFGGWSSAELAVEAYQDDAQAWHWRPVWPDDWSWNNGTMDLVFLPDAVDVRRLNSAFDFTFRGLDDAANRVIHVPAPRSGGSDDAAADPAGTAPPAAGEPADVGGTPNWVRLSEISWFVIATQLYREDGSFFRNGGINFLQMRNVIDEAFELGRFTRGASTISMQLVKNVFLTHERSVERKFQELVLTYWMTRLVPKERILEVYLNVIEWGPGINGISEAAREYFSTTPDKLSIAQSVWLSAITPRPLRWSLDAQRGRVADWMQRNIRDLLNGLQGRGLITAAERDAGLAEVVTFGPVVPPAADPLAVAAPATTADGEGLAPVAAVEALAPTDSGLLALPPEQRIGFVVRTTSRPLEGSRSIVAGP